MGIRQNTEDKERMKMSFDVFINFDGDCRGALEFYAKVFNLETS